MADQQGVAQRVIGNMISAGRTYPVHGYSEEMEFRRQGAEELADALSTEARAILNGMPVGYDREGAEYMAERLGLDLEGEDQP